MGWQAHAKDSGKARLFGLDFVRAFAILCVLTAHFGGAALILTDTHGVLLTIVGHAGMYGVEIFFVLSGFLIGGLLLDIAARDPSFRSWKIFMVRRWMRTLPLYVLWICVLLVVWPPEEPFVTALKYLALLQNLAWPMPQDNWFGVSWSLTVEEWFYLLFSGLFIALAARNRSLALVIACGAFLLLPFLARVFIPHESFDAGLRKVVIFRLDAIAYGVVMAWAYRHFEGALGRWRYLLLALGLLLATLPSLQSFRHMLGPWWAPTVFSFISFGLALALPWAVRMRAPAALLQMPIRWLAERSYCIYIIHLSLQQMFGVAVKDGYMGPVLAGIALVLTCGILAELSYRYFETPILRRRPPQFLSKSRAVEKERAMADGELPEPKPI